jgi:hypothetical protein
MSDYEAEARSTKRVPRDEFEAELFRRYIERETDRWYDTDEIRISVSAEHEDGVYELYVWEDDEDFLKIMEPKGQMRGKMWLAENEYPASEFYRVQVWHEVEGRQANYGAPPIPRWRAETSDAR